jgi:hypothetical protein
MKQVIDRLIALLQGPPDLTSGYLIRKFRWIDSDVQGKAPFMLFRGSGTGGQSDSIIQYPDVSIILVDLPTAIVTADERMKDIMVRLREPSAVPGLVRIDPLTQVQGPTFFENDRPMFTVTVRCIVEDH